MDYPPGWKIYIDDQPVEKIYKTDHALQSIIVPDGQHKVLMIFRPESYHLYIKMSYASAGILYIIVILSLVMMYKDKVLGLRKGHSNTSSGR